MELPQKIGKYVVQGKPLGQGGMGVVYRAVDPDIGRPVAIKMVLGAGDPELLERFSREIKLTANLHHPNIVIVYDSGQQSGSPYIVMEYLEGASLERVAITAPSPNQALYQQLNIIAQVCAGLDYAHKQGVVHRDIKPANILVLRDQSVKIVDFGIALLGDDSRSRLSKPGVRPGTPVYMSPEQLNGYPLDGGTDIYSAGVVLYELLTGKLPFWGPDETSIRTRILTAEAQPLSAHSPDYPAELQEVVSRALEKNRLNRYQTAEDFRIALSRIQAQLKPALIREWREQAYAAMDRSDWVRAKENLAEVLKLDPADVVAGDKLHEVEQILGREKHGTEAQRLRAQAEDALAQRQIDDALAFAEQAVKLDDSNVDLRVFRDSVRDTRERSGKARRAIARAESCLQADQLEAALAAANEALTLEPSNSEAQALRGTITQSFAERLKRQQFQSLLEEARRDIAARRHTSALDLLKRAAAIDAKDPQLSALMNQAMQGREAEKRGNGAGYGSTAEVLDSASRKNFAPPEVKPQQPVASSQPMRAMAEPAGAKPDSSEAPTILRPEPAVSAAPPAAGQARSAAAHPALKIDLRPPKPPSPGPASQPVLEPPLQRPAPEPRTRIGSKPARQSHWFLRVGSTVVAVVGALAAFISVYDFVSKKNGSPVKVQIVSTPTGAAIHLAGGGTNVDCVTPNCTLSLPKGNYELSASLNGYQNITRSIEATDNMPRVELALTPAPVVSGALASMILQTPGVKGATAVVDNKEYLIADGQLRLPAEPNKTYTVRVQKDGYEPMAERQVMVERGQETVVFKLKPLAEIASLTLRRATPDALVMLDGRTVGSVAANGSFETKISPGLHTVQLALDGRTSNKLEQKVPPRGRVVLDSLALAAATPPQPSPQPQPQPQLKDRIAQEWEELRFSNDRNRLEAFMARNPSSPFADLARTRVEQIDWTAANGSKDRSKLQLYLNQHADGRYVEQAREQIEQIDWNSALNSRDRAKIQAYLDRYSNGRYRQPAREALEQIDWDAVRNSGDVPRLQAFLNTYPDGRFAAAAKAAIDARNKPVRRTDVPAAPEYCPLPEKVDFDFQTPNRDKIGIWKGIWDNNYGRKFCIVITSMKSGEAQGIYSYDQGPSSPAGFRQVRGTTVSTQPGAITVTFAAPAPNSPVVILQFRSDGTVKANWRQGNQPALNAWVTKVR